MRSDLAEILAKVIGNIQKEMDKVSETDWVMKLEDNDCLFSIYFLNPVNRVDTNQKILRELKKIDKFFIVKSVTVGKTVTAFVQVKDRYI